MIAEVAVLLRQTADGGIHLTGTGFFILAALWFGLVFVVLIMGSNR